MSDIQTPDPDDAEVAPDADPKDPDTEDASSYNILPDNRDQEE